MRFLRLHILRCNAPYATVHKEENRYYEIMLDLKIGRNGARLFKFNIKIGRADGNYIWHYQIAKQ